MVKFDISIRIFNGTVVTKFNGTLDTICASGFWKITGESQNSEKEKRLKMQQQHC